MALLNRVRESGHFLWDPRVLPPFLDQKVQKMGNFRLETTNFAVIPDKKVLTLPLVLPTLAPEKLAMGPF